jgi:hypothetical protein
VCVWGGGGGWCEREREKGTFVLVVHLIQEIVLQPFYVLLFFHFISLYSPNIIHTIVDPSVSNNIIQTTGFSVTKINFALCSCACLQKKYPFVLNYYAHMLLYDSCFWCIHNEHF